MVTTVEAPWSQQEIQSARVLLDRAHQNEIASLLSAVKVKAAGIEDVEELWQLHDFLSAKRHELDGKYDHRQGMLVFVLAQLLKEGRVSAAELTCLATEKQAKIKALARI